LVRKLIYGLILMALLAGCNLPGPTNTPTPTFSATDTALPAQTQAPTQTLSPTATSTFVPTATSTFTPTPIAAAHIPIIEYHDPEFKMNDQVQMTLEWFADQMSWLAANGYSTLSAQQLVAYLDGEASFPYKSVVITFDIGTAKRANYINVVIPTLKKYGYQAIIFILANDSVVRDECKGDQYFCWDDFRSWAQEGLVSIASHGLFHPDFTKLTQVQMKYEVEQSRKVILEKTGQLPLGFAFPYDSAPSAGWSVVQAAGYEFAVAGNTRKDLTVVPNDPDRFHLPRLYPYSNPHIYPMLNGYNRSFADVVSGMTQPVVVASQPTQAAGTPPSGLGNVDQLIKICGSLPSGLAARQLALSKASFDPDLSAAARAKLPGFSVSPSCNYFGGDRPEAIVIHYTAGGDINSTLNAFRQDNGASAHYVIDRDGKVVQVMPEDLGALHVNCNGKRSNCVASCPICDGKDGALTEPYSRSIGIELVNQGHIPAPTAPGTYYEDYLHSFNYTYWEEYPEAQIAALKVLVEDIAARWNIPIDNQHILGHYRINQKVDPGPALNLFWPRAGNPPRPPIFTTAIP
jgi:N-acetyl-anhydromuramyl-L-alanine amidase AmpD/peptidoglycan/xylan/chitin deacetylase (PgdA/CDA1 family)